MAKHDKYKNAAENTIIYLADSYLKFGYFAALYAIAVDMLLNKEIKVDIVGMRDMVNVCIAANNPRIVVNFINKNKGKSGVGYESEGAYVCKGNLCNGPITDINKLEEGLI